MSSTNKRFVVAYILLVGLPLAGLAGVLKSGRHLSAPISIDGTWKVEANASASSDACLKAASSLLASNLVISQSGKTLSLNFNSGAKTPFSGALEGRDINASLGAASECANDQAVTLAASVDPKSDPKSLSGTLSVDNCPSCSPVAFHAVRQPKPAQSGGGH